MFRRVGTRASSWVATRPAPVLCTVPRLTLPVVPRCSPLVSVAPALLTDAHSSRMLSAVPTPSEDADAFLSVEVLTSPAPSGGGAVQHSLKIRTPLPTVTGVVSISLPATATVNDLVTELQTSHPDTASVALRDKDGHLYAGSTLLGHVIDKPWSLVLDDYRISALSRTSIPDFMSAGSEEQHPAYLSIKRHLLNITDSSIPFETLDTQMRDAARAAGVPQGQIDDDLAAWRRQLHQEGIILHFDQSPDSAIRAVVFVRPFTLHEKLQEALDVRGSLLMNELRAKEEELDDVEAELAEMRRFKESIVQQARSRVKLVAYSIGVFMIVQWGTIFHFVYEQSWDVMEPICYFIGSGYGILFYVFFMRTRQDPTSGNVFHYFFKSQQARLHEKLGHTDIWKSAARFNEERQRTRTYAEKLRSEIFGLQAKLPESR